MSPIRIRTRGLETWETRLSVSDGPTLLLRQHRLDTLIDRCIGDEQPEAIRIRGGILVSEWLRS